MDEKYIQDLFNQLGGESKFGKFDDFKYLISNDKKYRQDFYNAFGEKTLGAYNDFDELVKKNETSLLPSPPSAETTQLPSQQPAVKQPSIKEQFGGYYENMPANKAVSTYVKPVREKSVADFEDKSAEKEARNIQVRQKAFDTTAERRLKAKKQKIDEKALAKEKELLQKDIDEGNVELSVDAKGNKIYGRKPGIGESLVKGLKSSVDSLTDAASIAYTKATGSPEELANLYEMISFRKKRDSEREFTALDLDPIVSSLRSYTETTDLPTAEPGMPGAVAGFVGHIAPDVVLAAATGGAGNVAKMGSIGTKMYASFYGNKAQELYERGKQDLLNRGMDEKQASILAAEAATENAKTAAIPDAAINTLFFSGKLHSPAANNLISVLKAAGKDIPKVTGLGVAGSVLTSAEEASQGYNVGDWIGKAIDTGGDFAKLELIFKAIPVMAQTYRTLPKAAKSALKEFAVDPVVKPLVEAQLKDLPNGVDIMRDINEYEAATKNLRGVVSEEKMASLGGRMQKRINRINDINIIKEEIKQLEEKKAELPESLHEEIDNSIKSKNEEIKSLQKEIGNVDKEIEEINKSEGTGLEKEIDEISGEPLMEEISKPIELSTEIEKKPLIDIFEDKYNTDGLRVDYNSDNTEVSVLKNSITGKWDVAVSKKGSDGVMRFNEALSENGFETKEDAFNHLEKYRDKIGFDQQKENTQPVKDKGAESGGVGGVAKSVLNQDRDLKGGNKEVWMNEEGYDNYHQRLLDKNWEERQKLLREQDKFEEGSKEWDEIEKKISDNYLEEEKISINKNNTRKSIKPSLYEKELVFDELNKRGNVVTRGETGNQKIEFKPAKNGIIYTTDVNNNELAKDYAFEEVGGKMMPIKRLKGTLGSAEISQDAKILDTTTADGLKEFERITGKKITGDETAYDYLDGKKDISDKIRDAGYDVVRTEERDARWGRQRVGTSLAILNKEVLKPIEVDFSKRKVINENGTTYKALKEGKYQQAISEGRMTASDAKKIIESAGLEVPKDILELYEKETQSSKQEGTAERTAPVLEALKDVESTAKALEGKDITTVISPTDINELNKQLNNNLFAKQKELLAKGVRDFENNSEIKAIKAQIDFSEELLNNNPKAISEAYHKAKADGSNPELVKAVEDLLGKPKEVQKGIKETKVTETIPEKVQKEADKEPTKATEQAAEKETMVGVGGDVVVGAKPKPIDEQSIAASQKWIKDLYSLPDLTRIQDKNGNIYDIKGGKIRKLTLDKEGNVINAEIIHTDRDVHKRGAYSNPDFFNEGYRVLPEQSLKATEQVTEKETMVGKTVTFEHAGSETTGVIKEIDKDGNYKVQEMSRGRVINYTVKPKDVISQTQEDVAVAKQEARAKELIDNYDTNIEKLKAQGIEPTGTKAEVLADMLSGKYDEQLREASVAAPDVYESVEATAKALSENIKREPDTIREGDDLILKHGTPHDFSKFQLEKIGTGEGHQAFGYGLYFTDGSKIAEQYAKKLSEDKTGLVYDVKIKDGAKKEWVEWREPLEQDVENKLYDSLTDSERKHYEDYLDKSSWDNDHVGKFDELKRDEYGLETYDKPSAVGLIYRDLKDAFGQEKATEIFKRAGVDGIKYRSNSGRGDNFNYVVFDPNSIEIIKKEKPLLSGNPQKISEAYHKAKADGSNPELVKAVEELLGKPTEIKAEETITEPTKEQPITPEQVKAEPPSGGEPPVNVAFVYEGSKQQRERAVLTHLLGAKNIPESYKENIRGKEGLKYNVANMVEAAKVGEGVVKELGVDAALEVADSRMVHPSVGSAIFAESLNTLHAQEIAAREAGNTAEAVALAQKWADVSLRYAEEATAGGQFNAQIAHFYKSSPMGIVMRQKVENAKKFDEWFESKEKDFKEIFDEVIKSEEGEALLKVEVEKVRKEERAKERAARKERVYKKIDDAVKKWADKLTPKTTKGVEKQGIGTEEILKALGETMKKAYEVGEAIEKIIEDARAYLKEKLNLDEAQINDVVKDFAENLKEKDIDLEAKYRAKIEELERRIREKDFEAEKYKEKRTLSEKEQAAKDELEEVRKKYNEAKKQAPEYIEKRAKEFVERFRKKMKGLNDKQKEELIKKSVKKLIDSGALEFEDFRKIIAEVLGYKDFTPEDIKKIEQLTETINKYGEIEDKMVANPTKESIKEAQIAQQENLKAQMELYLMTSTKADIIQTLKAIYTGNLLSVPTLIKNVGQNVIAQATVRFPKEIVKQLADLGAYGIAAMKTKWVGGEPPALPARNLFLAQKGYFGGGYEGIGAAAFDFAKGVVRKDYFAPKEYQSTLSPRSALKELKLWQKGELALTNEEVADKMIRSTLGWQADFILRSMAFGDTVFRYSAEHSKAIQIAIQELGLERGSLGVEAFLKSPRKYAYKVFKEQGKTDKEASELAAEVEQSIIREGERAVFQEENWFSKKSAEWEQRLRVSKEDSPMTKARKRSESLLKTKIFPFVKIPANVYWSFFKAANPYFTMALSMKDAYLAMKATKQGKFAEARKFQEYSMDNLAHAVVGYGMITMADYWIQQGLIRASNQSDTAKKEREAEKLFGKQNQLNLGRLMGGGDWWVDLSWFGALGTVMDTRARMQEDKKRYELTHKEQEKSLLESGFDNMAYSAAAALNNLVFDQASRFASAITGSESQRESYYRESLGSIQNMFTGGTLPAISKAMLPYEARVKGDNIWQTLNNDLKYRNGLYRLIAGNPPAKVSIWGEPIKKEAGLKNVVFNMLGFESQKGEGVFGLILYDDFNRTQNRGFFPPVEDNEITVNGKKVKITETELADLQTMVGQARKSLVEPYVSDMGDRRFIYSNSTDKQKLSKLARAYRNGRTIGYRAFREKYPQYKDIDVPEADQSNDETE